MTSCDYAQFLHIWLYRCHKFDCWLLHLCITYVYTYMCTYPVHMTRVLAPAPSCLLKGLLMLIWPLTRGRWWCSRREPSSYSSRWATGSMRNSLPCSSFPQYSSPSPGIACTAVQLYAGPVGDGDLQQYASYNYHSLYMCTLDFWDICIIISLGNERLSYIIIIL